MTKVLAFDVDGVLTCDSCSARRKAEQAKLVREMIDMAKAQGYHVAVNTARPYPSYEVQPHRELHRVSDAVVAELRRANGDDAIQVCSRPRGSGVEVSERKAQCQQKLIEHFGTKAPGASPPEPNMAILIEDNPSNYVRVGSLQGKVDAHGAVSNGILVPEANGVTEDSVSQLRRALASQDGHSDHLRRSRAVLAVAVETETGPAAGMR